MKKKAAIVVGALVMLALALPLVLPRSAHAERSITIAAPPLHIYPDIASLRAWNEWSAWNTRADPSWRPVYTGPDLGVGAASSWTQSESGPGTQAITDADPARGVGYRIVVMGGSLVIDGRIALAPFTGGTRVTWTDEFDLSSGYFMRYFGPLMGGATESKLDESLAVLKERAEKRALVQ